MHESLKLELNLSKGEGEGMKEQWTKTKEENEDLKAKLKILVVQMDFLVFEYSSLSSVLTKVDPCFIPKSVDEIISQRIEQFTDETKLAIIKDISHLREINNDLLSKLIKSKEIRVNWMNF